jgi:hypothetical protein
VRREAGVADPLAGAGGVAREDLGLEELLVGPTLLAGPVGYLLGKLKTPRVLERLQTTGVQAVT